MHRIAIALGILCTAPAWANHPLITEDTGVLGKGGRQIEVHGERARDRDAAGVATRSTEVSAVFAYGITEKADVQAELPYRREVTDGAVASGRGDAALSLKWRFYEAQGLSLVFKPDLLLPTGRDERGLGAGRTRWAANLAAAYEMGRFELLGHLGYTDNRNRIGERDELWHLSAALLYAATEQLKLVLDLVRDTNPDRAASTPTRDIVFGIAYAVSEDVDFGLGLKKGLNDAANDRAVLAGVKVRW